MARYSGHPGGAGLHSVEEYVVIDDVYACRDLLVEIATRVVTGADL